MFVVMIKEIICLYYPYLIEKYYFVQDFSDCFTISIQKRILVVVMQNPRCTRVIGSDTMFLCWNTEAVIVTITLKEPVQKLMREKGLLVINHLKC